MIHIGGIGCGNMGGAILGGVAKLGEYKVLAYDRNAHKTESLNQEYGIENINTIQELVESSDYIMIGVKPHGVESTVASIAPYLTKDKVLISIAAGVSIHRIKMASQNICPVSVVMPNTPAMVGLGCCAICFDDVDLKDEQKINIEKLFAAISTTVLVQESKLPEFSALYGSGPAFVFYMLEAMQETAIRLGFSYDESKALIEKLFEGSVKLAQEKPEIPYAKHRLNVCSPNGSTIAGINNLDKNAVRGLLIEGVLASYKRACEMAGK